MVRIYRNTSFLSLFFYCFFSLQAQNVKIKAWIPGGKGHVMEILKVSDYISNRTELIQKVIIDSNDIFSINLYIPETQQIKFRIEYLNSSLYVEPEREYIIRFQPFYQFFDDKFNPFIQPLLYDYVLINSDSNELNFRIARFNQIFDSYLKSKPNIAVLHRNYKELLNFRDSIYRVFHIEDSSFFRNYVDYRLASLEYLTKNWETYHFISRYLQNQRVLHRNAEYMALFNDVFKEFLTSTSQFVYRNDLYYTVNRLQSYQAITDSIGRDSLLVNEEVRELVLLKSLWEFYNSPLFSKDAVLKILNYIRANSKFQEHKIIATNIIYQCLRLKPGSFAPPVVIMQDDKKIFDLEDYKGKYVYLSFFTSYSATSLAEFKVLERFYEKYNKTVEFISICMDIKPTKLSDYLKQYPFKWKFYHFNANYEIIDNYGVRDFPLFVLINPEGKISQYPAKMPSEEIEKYFQFFEKPVNKPNRIPGSR